MTEAESVFWNNSCVGLLSPQPCVPPKARQTVAVGLLSLRALQGYTSSSSFFFSFFKVKAQDGRHQRSKQGTEGTGLLPLLASASPPRLSSR